MDQPKSTSTRSRRTWGAVLLLTCLLALVLGVFGAVYFERHEPGTSPQVATSQPPASGPTAPTPVVPPPAAAPGPENSTPPQAVPPPESAPSQTAQGAPPAAPQPTPAPEAAAGAPPSPESEAQNLARISPSAAPANIAAAAPRYWVEFGAYEGAFYADRLKQTLDTLGIPATVTTAPGRDGRHYLRVRSQADNDRDAALAQLSKAQTALRIAPLLHRVAAVAPAAARPAPGAAATGEHWVQLGAFRTRGGAERLLTVLHKNDIQASVLERIYSSKESLYLVRVSGLADHAAAIKVAQQSATVLHSHDILIGESPRASGLHPRPPPR